MTKERICISLDLNVLSQIDSVRGTRARSELIEQAISKYFEADTVTAPTQAIIRKEAGAFFVDLRQTLDNIQDRLDKIEQSQNSHTKSLEQHNKHHFKILEWIHKH